MNSLWKITRPFQDSLCRFLIHRYMGQYLKSQISTNQLELNLADGNAQLQDVDLNVEFIDEMLDPLGLVRIVQGFVGEISLHVPWKNILHESTVVRIKGLDLTFIPRKAIESFLSQDLVASMIGSIASSMDLAKSIIEDDLSTDDTYALKNSFRNFRGLDGTEYIARIIDKVIGRIKLIFEDTTIRLESETEPATGLEFRIEHMEFVDEQLEATQQQESESPVTTQPTSLYTVTDLSKLLHIKGLRLYTDIWSNQLDSSVSSQENMDLSASSATNDPSLFKSALEPSMIASNNFQSCYSHLSDRRSTRNSSPTRAANDPNFIKSEPVLVAQLFGEHSTVHIRVNNPALNTHGAFSKKVDISFELAGTAFAFATPTQMALIQQLFATLVPTPSTSAQKRDPNKPMGPEHYQAILSENLHSDAIVQDIINSAPQRHSNQIYTASNSEQFYEFTSRLHSDPKSSASRRSASVSKFTSVSLADDTNIDHRRHGSGSTIYGRETEPSVSSQHGSNLTLVEKKPDVLSVSVRLPALVAIIAHEDPLSAEAVRRQRETDQFAVRTQIRKLISHSELFFKRAANLKLGGDSLDNQRDALTALYSADHLKLLCKSAFLKFENEFDGQRNEFELQARFLRCDLSEFLSADSIVHPPSLIPQHFDILHFERNTESHSTRAGDWDLQLVVNNKHSELGRNPTGGSVRLDMHMADCRTELDPSLLDRVAALLVPRPFFRQSDCDTPSSQLDCSQNLGAGSLRDNFFAETTGAPLNSSTDGEKTYRIHFQCSKWIVDLRIPIADYSPTAPAFHKKNLHDEYLRLQLEGAELYVPRFRAEDLPVHGEIRVKCRRIVGEFVGDPAVLECTEAERTFLHATGPKNADSGVHPEIQIQLKYDSRNKELLRGQAADDDVPDPSMMKSMYESFCRPRTEDQIEGPFSKANAYYGGNRLVSAGSRTELNDFASDCLVSANVTVELSIPQLNVLLPSHAFLERIYNRFANDLALFALKAPEFAPKTVAEKDLLSGLKPLRDLHMDRGFYALADSAGLMDSPFDLPRLGGPLRNTASNRTMEVAPRRSHQFALSVKAHQGRVLMATAANDAVEDAAFSAQLGVELQNGQFFLVHAYNETPHLDYFFVSAGKSSLFHRNLSAPGTKPFAANVLDANFASYHRTDLHAQPLPHDGEPLRPNDDDALALAIRLHSDDDQRDITVAFSLRNTFAHLRPFVRPTDYWCAQFAAFFNLVDYEVPGYVWPQTCVELHLHLQNTLVGYDHGAVVKESPFGLRLGIGSCHLSASIQQRTDACAFQCLLEDIRLYVQKRPLHQSSHRIHFADSSNSATRRRPNSSSGPICVKFVEVGLLNVEIDYTPGADITMPPVMKLKCENDRITMWSCADTIIEVANIATEFAESDAGRAIKSLIKPPQPPTPIGDLNTGSDSAFPQYPESVSSATTLSDQRLPSAPSTSAFPQRPSQSSLDSASTTRQITAEQHQKLVEMMSSAMREEPEPTPPPRKPKAFVDEWGGNEGMRRRSSSNGPLSTGNSDDDFVVVDEIVGSGITNAAGDPRVRILDEDFLLVSNHLPIPDESHLNDMVRLHDNHPPPILQYCIKDITLHLFLYGGSDFAESAGETKSYSQWEFKRDSSECLREGSEGGPFRDHTVCVEAKISKISLLSEFFEPPREARTAEGRVLLLNMLTIGDITILDRLLISEIDKFFYQYVPMDMPRRLNIPLISVRMVEDHQHDGKLKISVLPLRMNIDQDTLEFLIDFAGRLSADIKGMTPEVGDELPELPVMEIGAALAQMDLADTRKSSSASSGPPPLGLSPMNPFLGATSPPEPVVRWTRGAAADSDEEDEDEVAVLQPNVAAANLDDLFNEDDVQFSDSEMPDFSAPQPSAPKLVDGRRPSNHSLHSTTSGAATTSAPMSAQRHSLMDDPFGLPSGPAVIAATSSTPDRDSLVETASLNSLNRRVAVQTADTFYKEFVFEPACVIRFDYVGKRVKTEQGMLVGLLAGLTNLHCTELRLKEIRYDRGLRGVGRCILYAAKEWDEDLRKQLPGVVGTVGPLATIRQIAQGVCDLFYMPLSEMRKEDGRIVRGFQRGASSFGVSTASAALDALQQVASVIQGVAEITFDLVTPDYPYRDPRRHTALHRAHAPADFREGLHMASATLYAGLRDTAHTLHSAAQEDRARNASDNAQAVVPSFWGRGVLRQLTPTAIRQIIYGSQAAAQFMGGLKSQLRPEDHREEREKWRQAQARRSIRGRGDH